MKFSVLILLNYEQKQLGIKNSVKNFAKLPIV